MCCAVSNSTLGSVTSTPTSGAGNGQVENDTAIVVIAMQ